MSFLYKEIPLNTPLKKKPGLSKERIRNKVKIKIVDYDETSFLVGIKRGVKYVAKIHVEKVQDKKMISQKDVEKEIRKLINEGQFDRVIFGDHEKSAKEEPVKRRGRKPKTESVSLEVVKKKRGRPRKGRV